MIRNGLNIVGEFEAEMQPQQWQIERYEWDGATFAKTAAKVVPYQDFYGPEINGF